MKDIERTPVEEEEEEVNTKKSKMALALTPSDYTPDTAIEDDFTSEGSFHLRLSDDEENATASDEEDPENDEIKKDDETEDDILNKFEENAQEDAAENQEEKLLESDETDDKEVENDAEQVEEQKSENQDDTTKDKKEINEENENSNNIDSSDEFNSNDKDANEDENILKDGMDTEDLLQVTDVVKSVDESDNILNDKIDDNSNGSTSSSDEKDEGISEETDEKGVEDEENTEKTSETDGMDVDIEENNPLVDDNESSEINKDASPITATADEPEKENESKITDFDNCDSGISENLKDDVSLKDKPSDSSENKTDEIVSNTDSDTNESSKLEEESKITEDNTTVNEENMDTDTAIVKSSKRSLSEIVDKTEDTNNKKIKLTENEEENTSKTEPKEIDLLKNFADFITSKSLAKLTREDLEEYCLQKICEAVVVKNEVGELQHKLKQYETIIENWRKEVLRMSKQTKDLEIVNKKLLHELKQRNEKEKPVVPVKITRSVGLQVKLETISTALPTKRKLVKADVPATSQLPNASRITRAQVTPPNRQFNKVAPKSTSILTQALQKDGAVQNGARSNGTLKPSEKAVIDLTDEDDKKASATRHVVNAIRTPATKGQSAVKPVTTPVTQSVRLVTSQIKTTNAQSTPGVVAPNGARLMYLVHSDQSPLPRGGVMLKIQSPNGVIGQNGVIPTTQNGSSTVSVNTAVRNGTIRLATPVVASTRAAAPKSVSQKHPAPLPTPPTMHVNSRKPIPPKPHLNIRKSGQGIVLSWKMPYNLDKYESIASYQLYAYQETNSLPSSEMWRKVGDIKALALPMACTLTQFADGNKYYFSVRAVDVLKRFGEFSEPEHIML